MTPVIERPRPMTTDNRAYAKLVRLMKTRFQSEETVQIDARDFDHVLDDILEGDTRAALLRLNDAASVAPEVICPAAYCPLEDG